MATQTHDALVIKRLETLEPAADGCASATRLLVELDPASSCRQCVRGEGCGAGLLAARSQPVRLIVHDRLGAEAGQRVRIESIVDSHWLRVIAGAYGLPTLGLLTGVILPRLMGFEAEWAAALGGVAGITAALALWQGVIEPRLRTDPPRCRFGVIETTHTVTG